VLVCWRNESRCSGGRLSRGGGGARKGDGAVAVDRGDAADERSSDIEGKVAKPW
jgi:hypothetical protein